MPVREFTRIAVGCEGVSEEGYVANLSRFARDARLGVHIEPVLMRRGDALHRLEWFDDHLRRDEAMRFPFDHRFALLDTDQDRLTPQRAAQARALAARINVTVVWQEPSHEAMLLRHFEGHTTRRPADSRAALQALQRVWAGYEKPQTSPGYRRILTQAHLERAAGVEPQLRAFLEASRILPAT